MRHAVVPFDKRQDEAIRARAELDQQQLAGYRRAIYDAVEVYANVLGMTFVEAASDALIREAITRHRYQTRAAEALRMSRETFRKVLYARPWLHAWWVRTIEDAGIRVGRNGAA